MNKSEYGLRHILSGWESMFRPHILERGEDYFLGGAVGMFVQANDAIMVSVEGSLPYQVSIRLEDDGQIAGMTCSCPYAEDGKLCKHMAASLYALEAEAAAEDREDPAPPLRELIASMSLSEARAMLLELAQEDEMLAMRIRARTAGKLSPAHLNDIKSAIRAVGQSAADRHGYIDYDHAWDYIIALEEFLEQFARPLMERGLLMEAFDLVGYIFMEAGRSEMDDSDGGLTDLCASCEALWEELAGHASEAEQMSMYRWFEEACGDPMLMDYITEVLEDVRLRIFHTPKLLQYNLTAIDRQIQELQDSPEKSWSNEYRLSELVMHRLSLMERSGAAEKDIAAFKQKYFHLSAVREHEVSQMLEKKQYPQAIALLQQGKELDREKPGLVSSHSEKLIELYRKQKDEAALRKELRYHVFHCCQRDLSHIQALKALTPKPDWEDVRERFLASHTADGVRLLFLQSEGLYDRLLEAVLSSKSLACMDRFEAELRIRYPQQASGFYVERLTEEMARADKRSEYARLIAYLKKLRRYPEGTKTARDLADHWRRTFPRRRSMLDELRKAGY